MVIQRVILQYILSLYGAVPYVCHMAWYVSSFGANETPLLIFFNIYIIYQNIKYVICGMGLLWNISRFYPQSFIWLIYLLNVDTRTFEGDVSHFYLKSNGLLCAEGRSEAFFSKRAQNAMYYLCHFSEYWYNGMKYIVVFIINRSYGFFGKKAFETDFSHFFIEVLNTLKHSYGLFCSKSTIFSIANSKCLY